MKRFGYVFDPLCVIGCLLYAANRWLIKPHCHILFFHCWFNDLWLIPCALPPVLLLQRWCGLRTHDNAPTVGEIVAHFAGWSILFEGIGPHLMHVTGDPLDVVAYAAGSVVALVWWPWLNLSRVGLAGNFDWLAPHYRWMEWALAGKKLQRCRIAFLGLEPAPRRALLIGEGHGRFLFELLRAHPNVQCVCVDGSARMIDVARSRLRALGLDEGRVEFVHADLANWTPPTGFDLIATHFVLDCFAGRELESLVAKLAGAAAPGARWLVSDFGEPASGPAKWRARAILSVMYIFFRWAAGIPAPALAAPDGFLRRHGFVLRGRRVFEWGLLRSEHWELRPGASEKPAAANGDSALAWRRRFLADLSPI